MAGLAALVIAAGCSSGDGDDAAVAGEQSVRVLSVGAASTSVLPLVEGTEAYLVGLPPPEDATSVGNFVPEWDVGRVAVGNGASEAHWVHDDVQAKALAIEDPNTGEIEVIATNDLYMVFRADVDALRARVRDRLPADLAERVNVQVASSHNHHGPDTAFDVNHDWYESALDRWADAVVDAVERREPATLRTATGEHYFGVTSTRDPQVIDPTLNVLQAVGEDGQVVATVVNWSNHPEVTLDWGVIAPDEDCAALGKDPGCRATNSFFTADYPGHMARVIEDEVGGEALFVNGAVGALLTPLGAPVWEVTDEHPIGDGYTVPEGATFPGGATGPAQTNFRRTAVIGEQLGLAALRLLESDGVEIDDTSVSFEREEFFTRVSNIGFRFLGVVDEETGYQGVGHEQMALFECNNPAKPTEDTCEDTGRATVTDPELGLEIRAGEFVKSEVGYLRVGPVGMIFVPGEIQSTLTIGLPAEFREDPGGWYQEPEAHAFGDAFTTPGYLRNLMDDEFRWIVGLGNDELGYIVPISDYRVTCTADIAAVGGEPGTCKALADAGSLPLDDAIPAEQCRDVLDGVVDAEDAITDEEARQVVLDSCTYGQGLGNQLGIQPEDHYEETNSAGWDLADDVIAAAMRVTGHDDDAQVNLDFPGYWPENPPR